MPERVTIWVPGKPVNPKNVSGLGLWKHRRLIANAREHAAKCMLEAAARLPRRSLPAGLRWPWTPDRPKHVMFTYHASAERAFLDDDSLPYAISPIRDALGDMGLIGKTPGTWRGAGRVKDAPGDGHDFNYDQIVDRDRVGVEIVVEAREGVSVQPSTS